MFLFSMLFLNELVKTKRLIFESTQLLNIKMGKKIVRGDEKYSLGEKKELGELVEKYKKEYDKEVKVICHFSMQKVSTLSS